MIAAALLALVLAGVVGVVVLARWEARLAASAPARPALLAVADGVASARAARTARVEPELAQSALAHRPARVLQPLGAQG